MALLLTFMNRGFSAEKYDTAVKKLEEAGAGAPKGRLYHVCYGDTDNVLVTDVWDNMENFNEFGKTLVPILKELGVELVEPNVQTVHNIKEAMADTFA